MIERKNQLLTCATTGAKSSGAVWLGDMNSAITRFNISDGGRKSKINNDNTFDTLWLLHLFPDFSLYKTSNALFLQLQNSS